MINGVDNDLTDGDFIAWYGCGGNGAPDHGNGKFWWYVRPVLCGRF